MTRAIDRTEQASLEAAISRVATEMRLQRLLETSAAVAREAFGVSRLIVDRSSGTGSCEILAVFDETGVSDLWDLDPLLWDEANWAAMQFVPAGQVMVVHGR